MISLSIADLRTIVYSHRSNQSKRVAVLHYSFYILNVDIQVGDLMVFLVYSIEKSIFVSLWQSVRRLSSAGSALHVDGLCGVL